MARIYEGPIIEAEEVRGIGKEGDPIRTVTVYYAADGTRLAERDPCAPAYRAVIHGDDAERGCLLPMNCWFYDAQSAFVWPDARLSGSEIK